MDSMPMSGGAGGAPGGSGGNMANDPRYGGGFGGNDYRQVPPSAQQMPPQMQPPQMQPQGRGTQFYRDVYGNIEFANPALAGQRAQFGAQHTIGQYDQQGVWNPLAEQNSTNGVAGRSWGAGAGGVHPGFGGGASQPAWQVSPMMTAQQAYQQAQSQGDQRGALMAHAQMGGAAGNTSQAQMQAVQRGDWNAARGQATVAPGSTRTVPRAIR